MFAALVHPAITALNHRIERYHGWRPRRQLDTGRITPFPARPEPLALALHCALAYAVDQKLPEAARTFARAILAEIRLGVLDADDNLHRDLEEALEQLEPNLMVPAEYAAIASETGRLLAAHRLRGVAGGPPIVVMGVAGCGKSTVGELLARRLQAPFVEGDGRHPEANVAKMAAGEPLTDEDRRPWLDDLNGVLRDASGCVVVACSALKREYRERLDRFPGPDGTAGRLGVRFVYLHLDQATAEARVAGRTDHFMRPALVPSQFAALEPLEVDETGVRIDATMPVESIVEAAIDGLGRL
jgi:gluconokinase